MRPPDARRRRTHFLASLTRKLTRELGLDRAAAFVAGFSAGAVTAAILADTYPERYAAAGMDSGLARGSAHCGISRLKTMRRGHAPDALDAPATGVGKRAAGGRG
ncbi:PHB depolymerase family esterase [Pararhodobacter sp. SW119]|uniref:PHB depolymerase family esterase n=1 Tax=Pararhodobacter sp. SW119 TaxID=2780075 RepID=UPI002475B6F4|nr:PHB depolymerase family esterase [Pararhodobacter sp. SW119]